MDLVLSILTASWKLLCEASVYILFGIMVGGLLRVFLNAMTVARHLGRGRFSSVFKAALLGIPIPVCSCGVLPVAASLKKQGANNGAVTAFLISTPESGADSLALTYALLGPVMTVARPLAAFCTATVAGLTENLFQRKGNGGSTTLDLSCPVDNCCDGLDCPPEYHGSHHSIIDRLKFGMKYAFIELWGDLAVWFLLGILVAGVITTLISDELMTTYLGGGLLAMLIMLAAGVPLFICATASTPIAAALILKGASPGAALVFLLAGPATNIASLAVLLAILGKRAATIYLAAIAFISIICGLVLDQIYSFFQLPAKALVGQAAEFVPLWAQIAGAVALLALSIRPIHRSLRTRLCPAQESVQAKMSAGDSDQTGIFGDASGDHSGCTGPA